MSADRRSAPVRVWKHPAWSAWLWECSVHGDGNQCRTWGEAMDAAWGHLSDAGHVVPALLAAMGRVAARERARLLVMAVTGLSPEQSWEVVRANALVAGQADPGAFPDWGGPCG